MANTKYQFGNLDVHGNAMIGDHNRMQSSDIGPRTAADALHELLRLIEEAKKQVGPAAGEVMSEEAEKFAKEARSAEPKRDSLTITGEGLVSAAKTCVELVGPITAAVKAVIAML